MAGTAYDAMVAAEATRQGVDPALALSIMHQESGGNPNATSNQDAHGLMQLLPGTAQGLGVTDIYDPAQNIKAGVTYLKQGLDAYGGSYALTAARYFGGPNQKQWGPKTHKYVDDIAVRYNKIAADSPATPPPVTDATAIAPISDSAAFLNAAADKIAQDPAPPTDSASYKFLMDAADKVGPPAEPEVNPITGELEGTTSKPLFGANSYTSEMLNAGMEGAQEGWGTAPIGNTQYFQPGSPVYAQEHPIISGINTGLTSVANATVGPWMSLGSQIMGAATQGVGDAVATINPDLAAMITQPFAGGALGMAMTGQQMRAADARPLAAPLPDARPLAMADRIQPAATAAAREALAGTQSGAPAVRVATEPAMPPRAEPFAATPPANNLTAPPIVRNNLTSADTATNPAPPLPAAGARLPVTVEAPHDGSLSAATTPTELAQMSPKERQRTEGDHLGRVINSTAPTGEDITEYVPGSVPTEGQYSGSPAIAQQEMEARQRSPDIFNEIYGRQNEAHVTALEDIAGNKTSIGNLIDERRARGDIDRAAAWAEQTPVDAQSQVDLIDSILNGPAGKTRAVKNVLTKIRSDLFNETTGKIETSPERLAGVRDEISHMQSDVGKTNNTDAEHAAAELATVKESLDKLIITGAPKYATYLKNYAEASKPIDEMALLQDWLPKVVNQHGIVTQNGVRSLLKEIQKQRQAGGIGKAKSLTPEAIDTIVNVYRSIQRNNRMHNTGVAGSHTSMLGHVGELAGLATSTGLHAAASLIPFGVGNKVVSIAENAFKAKKAEKSRNALITRLIANPPKRD